MMLYFHINKKLFSKHDLNQIAKRYLNVLLSYTQFLVFSNYTQKNNFLHLLENLCNTVALILLSRCSKHILTKFKYSITVLRHMLKCNSNMSSLTNFKKSVQHGCLDFIK